MDSIKDEITELLAKEGRTWMSVVREAVAEKSWVPPAPKPRAKHADTEAGMLIEEAEELKRMLEELEARLGGYYGCCYTKVRPTAKPSPFTYTYLHSP